MSSWLKGNAGFRRLAIVLLATSWFQSRGGTLTGSLAPVGQGADVNLTINGALDWVHWGLYTDTSVDRKATVTPQIGSVVPVGAASGFTYVFQYSDNYNGYSWEDGTPFPAATNTTTGIWAYNFAPADSGFEFSVPADTNLKTLKVYVGAFNCRGRLTATLSDGSATSYTDFGLFNIGNGPGGVYTINFAANSSGQSLTITWVVSNPQGQTANVTLQAAALTANGANNPPYASITSPAHNATFSAAATISIHAAATDPDGNVTNVAFFADATKLGDVSSSPFTWQWNNVSPGHYVLTAKPTDNKGRTTTSSPVDVFVHTTGSSLSASVAVPPNSVDLTADGTADWTHWGLVTNTSFNYKSLVPRKISNFTKLGDQAVQRFGDNYAAFNWTDGTPILQAANSPTGIFTTGFTNGFMLTVPADTNSRTLRVYVGLYGAEGEFQTYLSDFSAPAYADTSLSSVFGKVPAVYTINYTAASPGQQLIVVYRATKSFDLTYGNVTLQAATLQGGPQDPLPVYIFNPERIGNDFALSFITQTNQSYTVQYCDYLPATAWTNLPAVSGNGALITVTNFNAANSKRFYRVQTQ